MKKKFVLTEEESKRILSLHKKKIEENLDNRIPLNEAIWERVRDKIYSCKSVKDKPTMNDTQLNKLAYNIKNWPTSVKWNLDPTERTGIIAGNKKAADWVAQQIYKSKNKGNFCRMISLYNKNYADDYFFEDYDNAFDGEGSFSILSQAVNMVMDVKGQEEKKPTTTTSKCPKIEKWFKDNGFVIISKKRYDQLANDNTRIRKFKYCPISKTNLFFAKVKGDTQDGDEETKPITGGGSTVRYGFNYQDALKALKSKGCSVTGGGASDEENFADDWRSTENQKQTVNTTVSKENIQSWAS
jgi:hypothetical protein